MRFGLPGLPWVCPSAPRRNSRGSPDGYGLVDQAWVIRNFDAFPDLYQDSSIATSTVEPFRIGSYGLNLHMFRSERAFSKLVHYLPYPRDAPYLSENRIIQPSLTPSMGDSPRWSETPVPTWSSQSGKPPTWKDRDSSLQDQPNSGLSAFQVPRHGRRPRQLPDHWADGQTIPGSINLAFADGHVQQQKLQDLWRLAWYFNYSPTNASSRSE
jgi:prepilin-type processing-associated H-X9-DG protein